jgi:hypothetical protein
VAVGNRVERAGIHRAGVHVSSLYHGQGRSL